MKRCKATNKHHTAVLFPVPNKVELCLQTEKYFELQSKGNDYLININKLRARNIIYLIHCKGLRIRNLVYFYDCFRRCKVLHYMAIENFVSAYDIDASLIFNHDLITEAVESNLVVPGFNPNTDKLAFDLWEYSK